VIARISPPRGHGGPHFVPLHRDERAPSRAIWVPVRGDRGRTGEFSWRRAARLCAHALRAQIDRAHADAHALHRLCDRRPRPAADDTCILHLARQLFDRLTLIQSNAARLLTPPRANDTIDIDAAPEREAEE
jgi:hypothetical protein